MDTIYALATAQGKAGVAVIRVSGPAAFQAAEALAGQLPPHRGTALRKLRDKTGEVLDEALVLRFDGPRSFTGENVVEFHLHGSTAIVAAVLAALSSLPALRMADPGEFTRRALENGRLDLAQVEGLADLIDAETEAQRLQAQRVFSGELGEITARWRRDLTRAAALIEAVIDFADEEVPTDVTPEVMSLLDGVSRDIERQISGANVAERIRTGFEVAILGAPNVGKSTLLNALAGREAAITSEFAGTTRDVIEVRMDLAGLPVTLLDTAGLRETEDVVEGIGIARARERARAADLRVVLAEPETALDFDLREDDIVLRPKADLAGGGPDAVSGKTGEGLDRLIERVAEVLRDRSASAGLLARERQRVAVLRAKEDLEDARRHLSAGPDRYDIAAEAIRSSIRALEMLIGAVGVEDLLDEIFASFCLGK